MARVAKIDNAIKKRFERNENKRKVDVRNKLVYFLIICEGEKTEPNYFKALEEELPRNTVELEIDGVGRNTIGLVNYTIKYRNNSCRKFDRVWAVFDKDDFPDSNFDSAIAKAASNKINCAWTNEAFELWFLLHFQYMSSSLKRDDYKGYLEREIRSKSGNADYKYLKNNPDTYSVLQKFGNQRQAIQWARQLKLTFTDQRYATHNPCTLVHELIEELLNPGEVLRKIENSENESIRK
jgi:hypothetical protein